MSEILDSVSYDQYDDIPCIDNLMVNSKIIFSEQAYIFLLKLINTSIAQNRECGCFLVGRKDKSNPFVIYFDFHTSEFQCEDAFFQKGSVVPTQANYEELNQKLSEYDKNNIPACIIHFHTHNRRGFYESISDQDYLVYAKMAYDNSRYTNLGMLGFPLGKNTFGLNVVLPCEPKKIENKICANFYSFPNIFYCSKNNIYRIGNFQKRYTSRKTNNLLKSRKDNIIQNYQESAGSTSVNGIGKDPNTNLVIEDVNNGYIDANMSFCFPEENINYTFPKIMIKTTKK